MSSWFQLLLLDRWTFRDLIIQGVARRNLGCWESWGSRSSVGRDPDLSFQTSEAWRTPWLWHMSPPGAQASQPVFPSMLCAPAIPLAWKPCKLPLQAQTKWTRCFKKICILSLVRRPLQDLVLLRSIVCVICCNIKHYIVWRKGFLSLQCRSSCYWQRGKCGILAASEGQKAAKEIIPGKKKPLTIQNRFLFP